MRRLPNLMSCTISTVNRGLIRYQNYGKDDFMVVPEKSSEPSRIRFKYAFSCSDYYRLC